MQDQVTISYNQAVEFFEAKKYKKSFLKLIEISNQYSKNADFLFLLSEVQSQLRDFTARQKTLEVLCEISNKASHKFSYMKQLMMNKKINLALDVGLSVLHEELSEAEKSIYCDLMSQIYIHENDLEGLREMTDLCLKNNSITAQFHYSSSLLCFQTSDELAGLHHLREAVKMDEKFDQAWVALALLHGKMGDSELSRANLEKALDANPTNSTALKHYSKMSVDSGSVDKAVDKISFYLQIHNFDEDMTVQFAELMKTKNNNDIVQRESEKLSYYYGKQYSL